MRHLIVPILILVWAVALWIVLFYAWHRAYKEWKSNRANRLRAHAACVLDRREAKAESGAVEYMALFEFDGRQKEYSVDPGTYDEARVGREGILYLRGGRFEAFEPKSEGERAEDLYRRVIGS